MTLLDTSTHEDAASRSDPAARGTYSLAAPDLRAHIGQMVRQRREELAAQAETNRRADAALKATNGDKLAALALMLNEPAKVATQRKEAA